MPTAKPLDHLVYAVHNLELAISGFQAITGITPHLGGSHPTQGTKNALVNLGKGAYLELIAKDPENTTAQGPIWMGLDLLSRPRLTRWAVKSNTLEHEKQILAQYQTDLSRVTTGSRRTTTGKLLQWQLTLPSAQPEVELMPFLIDWSASEEHPTDALPNMGCSLIKVYATHPQPQTIRPTLKALGTDLEITLANETNLHALIQCPKGEIII